jgi:inosine-uridine nucleoside N-ribohydrolase
VDPEAATFVINNDVDGAIIQQAITIDVAIPNFNEVTNVAQAASSMARFAVDAALLGSLN